MNRYLILKLLAITLVVVVFVVAVIWLAIDTLAAGYFVTLMQKYHISPEPAHDMFVSAVHHYLLWSFFGAVLLAVALSYLMLHRVLTPLTRMTRITSDVAAGNFNVRVPVSSRDEIGQLAEAFNQMAADLEQHAKLRRNLMIDVAHELRTPLTNIRGYLEALHDGVLPPSRQTFTLLQEETGRLTALVEDVLQLARADAARGRLELAPLDFGQAVKAAVDAFRPAIDAKGITLRITGAQETLTVAADRKALARILRNLTDNAVRYTPAGAQATIAILVQDRRVILEYGNPTSDLRDEDLPLLFERFYRGEKSRSRAHGGAGIGLSIVKELVEAHGGSVSAHLTGGRLCVRIALPMDQNAI